jgi:hypothetical protein
MEPIHAVAELYSKRNSHGLAHSALPNAPVLPYVAPRHRLRRIGSLLRRPLRRPVMALRPARYSTEC